MCVCVCEYAMCVLLMEKGQRHIIWQEQQCLSSRQMSECWFLIMCAYTCAVMYLLTLVCIVDIYTVEEELRED